MRKYSRVRLCAALLLCLIMAAALCACASNKENNTTPTEVPATPTAEALPTENVIPVTPTAEATPTVEATPTEVPATPTPEATPTEVPATPTPEATPTEGPATPTPEATPTEVPATPTPEATPTEVPATPTPEATIEAVDIDASFPDPVLREYVRKEYDFDGDGKLVEVELRRIKEFRSADVRDGEITDVTGLEKFIFLEELNLVSLNFPVDYSLFPNLTYLATTLYVESIDLSKNPKLTEMAISGFQGSELDISCLKNMRSFSINGSTSLTKVILGNNPELKGFAILYTGLESIDLSGTPNLESIVMYGNPLTSLDISHLEHLHYLKLNSTYLTSLDLTKNKELYIADCAFNKFTELKITGLEKLVNLDCSGNRLTKLDVTGVTGLAPALKNKPEHGTADSWGTPERFTVETDIYNGGSIVLNEGGRYSDYHEVNKLITDRGVEIIGFEE